MMRKLEIILLTRVIQRSERHLAAMIELIAVQQINF